MPTKQDLREFIEDCMNMRSYFETVRNITKTAAHFKITKSAVSRMVAVSYIPEKMLIKTLENEIWRVSYLDRIIRLRRTTDGYTLKQASHGQVVNLDELDYTEVNRAIDLVNDGQITNRTQLETYVIARQKSLFQQSPKREKSALRRKKEHEMREEIENEVREEYKKNKGVKIPHLLLTSRNLASKGQLLKADIIYGGLLEYASEKDITLLREDINREIKTLVDLLEALDEGKDSNEVIYLGGRE